MKYALVRAISSQPKGSPSLEDIWFFIPLVIAMGISLALFFILKKKRNDNAWIFGGLTGFLFLAMVILYDPFLVAKSKNLLKAVLSVWLIISSIILGMFTFNLLYLYCFWKFLTMRRRIYSVVNGVVGLALSVSTLYFALNLP